MKGSDWMLPLWIEHSIISRYSIGWRMGYGEDYVMKFSNWFDELSNNEKEEYINKYPEPIEWTGWYEDENPEYIYDGSVLAWDKYKELKYNNEYVKNKHMQNPKECQFLFFSKEPFTEDEFKVSFEIDHEEFFCMEQYMLAEKAVLFEDFETRNKITSIKDDYNALLDLDKSIKNYNETIWLKNKYRIILQGYYYKFAQDSTLRKALLKTGDKVIVYANPNDIKWGTGKTLQEHKEDDANLWKGQNLLGYAFMEVRDEIKRVFKNIF